MNGQEAGCYEKVFITFAYVNSSEIFSGSATTNPVFVLSKVNDCFIGTTPPGETKDGKLWLVYQNGFLQEYDIKGKKYFFQHGCAAIE